jgi:hypothetical protein
MSKVTPTIGKKESEVAFEARIVAVANLIMYLSWPVCFVSLVQSPLHVSLRGDRLPLLLCNFRCQRKLLKSERV